MMNAFTLDNNEQRQNRGQPHKYDKWFNSRHDADNGLYVYF